MSVSTTEATEAKMHALIGVSPSLAGGEGRGVMVYTVREAARSPAQWLLWEGLLGYKLLSTAATDSILTQQYV